MYLSTVYRFDDVMVAVGKTKKEAEDALIKEYIETFEALNDGEHPKDIMFDYEESYLDVTRSEMYTTKINYGEVIRI